MRVLILNWRDMAHPNAGGSEVYAQQLARHWASKGHEVTYFCAAVAGEPEREAVDGYQIIRRGSRMTVYRRARIFFQDTKPYDVILEVINTRPFFSPSWSSDVPVVALIYQVAREVWRYEVPFPLSVLGRYVLEPKWLRQYRDCRVLTISGSSRASLAQYGLRNLHIVSVGADDLPALTFPAKEPTPTLVWVGRLAANKRPDHAIAALPHIQEHYPDVKLWVIGDGPMAARLRRSAGRGVEFLGRVTQREKYERMARAWLLVATSVREGWGMTVTEAAAVGTPAISYDVAGLRDSTASAGGTVVPPSPVDLAAAALAKIRAGETSAPVAPLGVRPWQDVSTQVMTHLNEEMRCLLDCAQPSPNADPALPT